MLKPFAVSFLNRHLPLLALAAVCLAPSHARALEGRGGLLLAEGSGVWLEGRHRFGQTDLGVHLAASSIMLDVDLYTGISSGTGGTMTIPGRVNALFLEWGVVLGRPVYTSGPFQLEVNTGLQGGLLDGTEDEGGRPLARTMILVPLHLDGTWHPFEGGGKRFGFQLGAGGVWTTPGDEEHLYPEVSAWRWQLRSGVLF